MALKEYLERKFNELQLAGHLKTRLFMKGFVNPGHYYQALKGTTTFSEALLRQLASIPELSITYEELMALKDIDERGKDTAKDIALCTLEKLEKMEE